MFTYILLDLKGNGKKEVRKAALELDRIKELI
jgi:hypothetical protein